MVLQLVSAALALGLDRLFGEPARFHPLVGFGNSADKVESLLNLNKNKWSFYKGVVAWCVLILPVSFFIYWLDNKVGSFWVSTVCGWLAIGSKSLRQHGQAVFEALQADDLDRARIKTSYLVSRDTSTLNETNMSKATIESLLENGSDAVFAPLFWLIVGGAPAVVLYRLSNTLDAMWGYRNKRFEQFGKFSARVDDVLNYIPARISALLYVLSGNSQQALSAWKRQARQWYSPNAGVVMAAGAGALNLQLGGDAVYHGKRKQRPLLGSGKAPVAEDIQQAIELLCRSERWLFIFLCLLGLIIWSY